MRSLNPDSMYFEISNFSNVSIIGTNVNKLYYNKVQISLSKGGTSCLGYEMMAVAKK